MIVPTPESFLKDVSNHSLKILKDDGVYRHLVATNQGSSVNRFEIVTYPNYLVVCGDMGDFLFRRLFDMFTFFRDLPNMSYAEEKCEAGETRQFCPETAMESVIDRVAECWDKSKSELTPEELEDIQSLSIETSDEYAFMDSINDLCQWPDLQVGDKLCEGFQEDFYPTLDARTYRFEWCVRAIHWAIQEYDKQKATCNEQVSN